MQEKPLAMVPGSLFAFLLVPFPQQLSSESIFGACVPPTSIVSSG